VAGYLISIGSDKSGKAKEKDVKSKLRKLFKSGLYATLIAPPASTTTKGHYWKDFQSGTFADFLGMKDGDFIFFFANRLIYGVGVIKSLSVGSVSTPIFLNSPRIDNPSTNWSTLRTGQKIIDDSSTSDKGMVFCCAFEPYPFFYEDGVDMDDLLSSSPKCFKMIRAFEKLSFIKLDDVEAYCMLDVLLSRLHSSNQIGSEQEIQKSHQRVEMALNATYLPNPSNLLIGNINSDNSISQEMAIESHLLWQLTSKAQATTIDIFGEWDYISHQVVASPQKGNIWMNKMDIFAYSYLNLPKVKEKVKERYCVIELKKDAAIIQDVDQVLKYVDWIKDEYAGNNYSSIKAFLVAYEFDESIIEHVKKYVVRNYQAGRPIRNLTWHDLTLVSYKYNPSTKFIDFHIEYRA